MKGCIPRITVKLDSGKYLWDGSKWIDIKNFTIPPLAIIEKLNEEIKDIDLDYRDMALTDLTTMASNFKDNGNIYKALEIIEYVLSKVPDDSATLSVLCSLLRKNGKPDEALIRTDNYNHPNTALLTSRAAAMCDLEQWEEAKREVGRALAMTKGNNQKQEAFNVVKRIKENRPDLY